MKTVDVNQRTRVDAEALRRLDRLLQQARQQLAGIESFAGVGNMTAVNIYATELETTAHTLAAELAEWPDFGVGHPQEPCPQCGRALKAFNLFTLDAPAFVLCSVCDFAAPTGKAGFYSGRGGGAGYYGFADPWTHQVLAVVVAEHPADAAARFQREKRQTLTLDREPQQADEPWVFLRWTTLTAAGRAWMYFLGPLVGDETIGQFLDDGGDSGEWTRGRP